MILKLLTLGIWMVLVPWGIGYFALWLSGLKERKNRTGEPLGTDMGYAFCLGYVLTWALFQLIAVPYIVKGGIFSRLAFVFEMISLTLAIAGALLFLNRVKCSLRGDLVSRGKAFLRMGKFREKWIPLALWAVFLAGLLFQIWQAYHLAYADGDDAFYIPVSVTATLGNTLYIVDPYTGESTRLNMRYGLAPFPIWVAFIASRCRVNAAVAAHSLMPIVLIPLTYVLYLELGKCLCSGLNFGVKQGGKEKKEAALPLFMVFVALLQIFGNYSIYPASTFLLTRTRQGKAAVGNVILPFFFLLLTKMAQEVKEQGRARWSNVLWLMAAMTAGSLCSTMSALLCSMFVTLTTFLIFLLYRKASVLVQGLLGCLPGVVYALLYLNL